MTAPPVVRRGLGPGRGLAQPRAPARVCRCGTEPAPCEPCRAKVAAERARQRQPRSPDRIAELVRQEFASVGRQQRRTARQSGPAMVTGREAEAEGGDET
jgi:hypothetical protein